MKAIGILPQYHLSYVDHLVPLCQLMNIPLLVTDPEMQDIVERYYPPMEIILAQPDDFNLDPYLANFDIFFYVDFFRKGNGTFQFQDYFSTKRARSVMSLHGNPDKYWDIYWLERLNDEDIILAYGPQLLDILKKKGICKQPVVCGNYRLEFYKQHEVFFDQLVPFQKKQKTILYAPTWASAARHTERRTHYSPFFDVYRTVFEKCAKHCQLIVKLHPHLIKTMPEEVQKVRDEYPEIYFLQDFPPIYPLLKQIDIYLGDYSSIGYDFLYFDRPLYFLQTNVHTALQEYGQKILLNDLPNLIEKKIETKKFYSHVFDEKTDFLKLKQEIEYACRCSFD